MGYIYKITNNINNKIYIGKTELSIQKRFQQHCRDAFKSKNEKRPLYAAMKKYGIEHFQVELIEEVDNTEDREIYWIDFYKSYSEGYNATLGGEGRLCFDYQKIYQRLLEYPYPSELAKEFNCCVDTIYNIAKQKNIKVKNKSNDDFKKALSKPVFAYTKDNQFVKKFDSVS